MADALDPVRAALAALSDVELEALQQAAKRAPVGAPALQGYLRRTCDGEHARRRGESVALTSPFATIPRGELGASFLALAALLVAFDRQPRIAALVEAIGDALEDPGPGPVTH